MTARIQFNFPRDLYERLISHPDCKWGKRDKFYSQILTDFLNSPQFRLKVIEQQHRILAWELDRARRERDTQAKSAEFWRNRAAELQKTQPPAGSATPDSTKSNAA